MLLFLPMLVYCKYVTTHDRNSPVALAKSSILCGSSKHTYIYIYVLLPCVFYTDSRHLPSGILRLFLLRRVLGLFMWESRSISVNLQFMIQHTECDIFNDVDFLCVLGFSE